MTPRPGGFWSDKTNTQPYPPKRRLHLADVVFWVIALIGVASILWCVAYGNGVPGGME